MRAAPRQITARAGRPRPQPPPRARGGGYRDRGHATGDGRTMASRSTSTDGVNHAVGNAFLNAAMTENVTEIEAAVEREPSVVFYAEADCGETALHKAVDNGHKEVAEVLLRANAAVDAQDSVGWTPLHKAALNGHKEVADVLLRAHAAVDAQDSAGCTPLHRAAGGGCIEVADVLLRAHAAVDAQDSAGWTPLHKAALNGHKEVADVLLRAHAPVDAQSSNGRTPLHVAAFHGHKEVAEVLLCAGAPVDALDRNKRAALREAARAKHLPVVRLLLEWRAIPDGIRPSRARAGLSTTYRQLRDAFDETVSKTEQELESARAAWLASRDATGTDVAAADPTTQALVDLQAAYDNFVAAPAALSVGALEAALTPPNDRDVRWHVLAHRVLLFAARVGVFGVETAKETEARRIDWYERVYQPVIGVRTPCDRAIVALLVRRAADNGLVEPLHISVAGMAMELRTTFYAEVVGIHRRLTDMRKDADCAGQQLRVAIEQVNKIGQYIIDKEDRERKVALAKSAVKIGVSLAPVVGGVLGATVDVVAGLADGLPGGAAAVVRCVADPADLVAARQVLVMVSSVEGKLSLAQAEQLSAAVQPYQSVAALEKELGSVAMVLNCGGAEVEGGVDAIGDSAGDGEDSEAASDAGSDPLEDFKGVIQDEAIERGGDKVDELRIRAASRPAIAPAAGPVPSASGGGRDTPPPPIALPSSVPTATAAASRSPLLADAGCGATTPAALPAPPTVPAAGATAAPRPQAAAPRPSNADIFAGARDWTVTETADRLVECVARVYDAPERAALQAIVRATAAEHGVTGESLVESPDVHEMAVGLLGEWGGRLGVVASVKRFIEKMQRFAV